MVKVHPYYSKKSNDNDDNFNILCGVVLGLLCCTLFCVGFTNYHCIVNRK